MLDVKITARNLEFALALANTAVRSIVPQVFGRRQAAFKPLASPGG
jgi:hypothetical protein